MTNSTPNLIKSDAAWKRFQTVSKGRKFSNRTAAAQSKPKRSK